MKDVFIVLVTAAIWLLVAASAASLLRPEDPWGSKVCSRDDAKRRFAAAAWRRQDGNESRADVAFDACRSVVSTVGGRLEPVRPQVGKVRGVVMGAAEPILAPFRRLRLNLAVVATDDGRRRLDVRAPYGAQQHSLDLAPLMAGLVLSAIRIYLEMI